MRELWNSGKDYICSRLEDVEVDVCVGLHPWEKHPERPTRLIVNVELYASLPNGAEAQSRFMDYDTLRNVLKSWSGRSHTPLLETLADELIQVAFQMSHVEACRVSLMKPDIFNEAKGAGIELYRVRKA